ncbi:MAG: FHA domain-containing protein, partial [Bacteroidales bacterium]|nr:FHA domain-containing protein [Bacteroidales bacterium]
MKSIFGGEGRRYYTLVHKVSSQYHKAGESQPIIVDEIELGRDPACQVRFDENFPTVSRRHAAIVKDGDNWKLIQLSQTNTTYLNGHPVQKEWYLQNGDEIQLSTNGPKLGFIIPEGKKGLVSSIGLTARLNLFRQQALRPYK